MQVVLSGKVVQYISGEVDIERGVAGSHFESQLQFRNTPTFAAAAEPNTFDPLKSVATKHEKSLSTQMASFVFPTTKRRHSWGGGGEMDPFTAHLSAQLSEDGSPFTREPDELTPPALQGVNI